MVLLLIALVGQFGCALQLDANTDAGNADDIVEFYVETRVEDASCDFDVQIDNKVEGTDYECGNVFVPRRRDKVNGPNASGLPTTEMRLHFIVFKGAGYPFNDATFLFTGGPGQSGDGIINGFGFDSFLLEQGDIVFLAPRGTRYTSNFLDCSIYSSKYDCLYYYGNDTAFDRLPFSTSASAEDVNELQELLGYPEINGIGVSYGTKLLQAVMATNPDFKFAVMDSPSAFNSTRDISAVLPILSKLGSQCEAVDCGFDVVESFISVLSLYFFTQETIYKPFVDPLDGASREIGFLELLDTIKNAISFPDRRYIPQALADIAKCTDSNTPCEMTDAIRKIIDYSLTYTKTAIQRDEGDKHFASGVNRIVNCSDGWNDDDSNTIKDVRDFFVLESDRFSFDTTLWQERLQRLLAPVPVEEKCPVKLYTDSPTPTPIHSQTPVLLLEGDFDALTPQGQARAVSENMPNKKIVTLENVGHSLITTSGCARNIFWSFIKDTDAFLSNPDEATGCKNSAVIEFESP